jgi:DNA-binding XRE family transcriptional regulator
MKKIDDPVHDRWLHARQAFAKNLKRFRVHNGASQSAFAKRLGISTRTLIDLEGGKYKSALILNHLSKLHILKDNEKADMGITVAYDLIYGPTSRPNHVLDFLQHHRAELSTIAYSYYQQKGLPGKVQPAFDEVPVFLIPTLPGNAPLLLDQIDSLLTWNEQAPPFTDGSLDIPTKLQQQTPTLYSGFLYRFLGFSERGKMEFCPGDYFSFLNTCEALSYELADRILETERYHDAIKTGRQEELGKVASSLATNSANELPLRHKASLLSFRSRCTAFGTCALVVVKRTNAPPDMVLYVRSHQLSETPGLTHVVPAGTFQPNCSDNRFHKDEFSFQQNLIREFVEELLEDKHLRSDPGELTHFDNMFIGRARQFVDIIIKAKKFTLLSLGILLDPLNLKPEVATVFLVHEAFLDQVTQKLYKTWETGNFRIFHFSLHELDRKMSDPEFVPTGRAHLSLVKSHFHAILDHLNSI